MHRGPGHKGRPIRLAGLGQRDTPWRWRPGPFRLRWAVPGQQWDLCKLLNHSISGEGGRPGGYEVGDEKKRKNLHLGDGAICTQRPMYVFVSVH